MGKPVEEFGEEEMRDLLKKKELVSEKKEDKEEATPETETETTDN